MADVDTLRFLETGQLIGSGNLHDISCDSLFEICVLAQRLEITLQVVLSSPAENPGFFRNQDADTAVLERITVDQALGDT